MTKSLSVCLCAPLSFSPTSHYVYIWDHLLTHWGRVTHICVGNITIIGSNNGFLPGRRKAIIWTNAAILLIRSKGINFSEISNEIDTSSSNKKMPLQMSSAKYRPSCLSLCVKRVRCWPDLVEQTIWVTLIFILLLFLTKFLLTEF